MNRRARLTYECVVVPPYCLQNVSVSQPPPGCDLWGNEHRLLPGAGWSCVSRIVLVSGAIE